MKNRFRYHRTADGCHTGYREFWLCLIRGYLSVSGSSDPDWTGRTLSLSVHTAKGTATLRLTLSS